MKPQFGIGNNSGNRPSRDKTQITVHLGKGTSVEKREHILNKIRQIEGVKDANVYFPKAQPEERMFNYLQVSLLGADETGAIAQAIEEIDGVYRAEFPPFYYLLEKRPPSP